MEPKIIEPKYCKSSIGKIDCGALLTKKNSLPNRTVCRGCDNSSRKGRRGLDNMSKQESHSNQSNSENTNKIKPPDEFSGVTSENDNTHITQVYSTLTTINEEITNIKNNNLNLKKENIVLQSQMEKLESETIQSRKESLVLQSQIQQLQNQTVQSQKESLVLQSKIDLLLEKFALNTCNQDSDKPQLNYKKECKLSKYIKSEEFDSPQVNYKKECKLSKYIKSEDSNEDDSEELDELPKKKVSINRFRDRKEKETKKDLQLDETDSEFRKLIIQFKKTKNKDKTYYKKVNNILIKYEKLKNIDENLPDDKKDFNYSETLYSRYFELTDLIQEFQEEEEEDKEEFEEE